MGIVVVAALAAMPRRAPLCDDHGDPSANQFGRQRGKSIKLILGPAVFDRHVLAFDIAGVLETLAKSAQAVSPSCQAIWGRGTRSPASPAAAPSPRAATPPPRRRAA